MNPRVTAAHPEAGYTVVVTFSNGEKKKFDVTPYLDYTVFRPLRDPAVFCRVTVAHGTLVWPGEIDFCPDTVYAESVPCADAA